VIYRRAEFFKDDFEAVFEAVPRVRATFGKEAADALKSFARARNRILSSSDMLPIMSHDQDADRETTIAVRRDIYGKWGDDDQDPVGEMVVQAITQLEERLLPILTPKQKSV
jgi:hypothetical protein